MTPWTLPRRRMIVSGLSAICLGVFSKAWGQDNGARPFNIQAQPLDQALSAFSLMTGLQMLYDSALAAGRTSAAVRGVMTVRQAIGTLLVGTDLAARFTASGAVVIYASATSAVTLNPITAVAAPIVGSPEPSAASKAYVDVVQKTIIESLHRNSRLSQGDYRLSARVWIRQDGAMQRVDLLSGSGDASLDAEFRSVTSDLRFTRPPLDLPQPMRLEFRVRSHN